MVRISILPINIATMRSHLKIAGRSSVVAPELTPLVARAEPTSKIELNILVPDAANAMLKAIRIIMKVIRYMMIDLSSALVGASSFLRIASIICLMRLNFIPPA